MQSTYRRMENDYDTTIASPDRGIRRAARPDRPEWHHLRISDRPGDVLLDATNLRRPRELHPAFYGCFDWHSAVHSHWLLVRLLRLLPGLPEAAPIRSALNDHLTETNLGTEAAYFAQPGRRSFERPYGWAWLLKLAEELLDWDDPDGRRWSVAIAPLAQQIATLYLEYLPRLTYPIRSGVHSNTAFGLTFALDYARASGHALLGEQMIARSIDYYGADGMRRRSGNRVAATSSRPAWSRPICCAACCRS